MNGGGMADTVGPIIYGAFGVVGAGAGAFVGWHLGWAVLGAVGGGALGMTVWRVLDKGWRL